MPLNWTEHKEIAQKAQGMRRPEDTFWGKLFFKFLWIISKIPYIKTAMKNSLGGLHGRIFKNFREGNYRVALDCAYKGVEKASTKTLKDEIYLNEWWSFMKEAVLCVDKLNDGDEKDKLITMVLESDVPRTGYHPALCFLMFSGWKYDEHDFIHAIEYANRAAEMDETWGEPHFVLGWYGLALNRFDPLPHFKKAVDIDRNYMKRIENDSLCRKHLDVVDKLREIAGLI